MYFDAEYGEAAPLNLARAILLYGSGERIRLATEHQLVNDPQGGPPLLDAGEPLTRGSLETLVPGLGSELPVAFLPGNVLNSRGVVGTSRDSEHVLRFQL